MTQEDLANAVSIKPERVMEFEAGESRPTFWQLTLIANKLDRPHGFFFAPAPVDPDILNILKP